MLAEIALMAILHQCCVTTDEAVRYQQLAMIEQDRAAVTTDYYDYEWYEPSYDTYTPEYVVSDGLNAFTGVNYYDGRRETYYSSNVLYHYRTNEWWVDEEGFYRTDDGYYVVAASDMEQGTVFEGSKGECIVLDCGCADGTTDYYVRW